MSDKVINELLSTHEGKLKLSASMKSSTNVSVESVSIPRKCLHVYPLQPGELARFENSDGSGTFVVPIFEITSMQGVTLREVKSAAYKSIQKVQQKIVDDIIKEENKAFFNLLNEVKKEKLAIRIYELEKFLYVKLNTMFSDQNIVIIINQKMMPTFKRIVQNNISILNIITSHLCAEDEIFILPEYTLAGVMPIQRDIEILPTDNLEFLQLGFTAYELIGMQLWTTKVCRFKLVDKKYKNKISYIQHIEEQDESFAAMH